MFNNITPIIIKIIPTTPYKLGIWLYLNTPNKVTAVIVNPPYVAYVKPTGITFIALDKQKIHATIEIAQKIVGPIFVNPFVDFKKPLEVIPKIIANNKKIYPDKFVIYYTVLPSRFTIKTPEIIKANPIKV